MRFVWWCRHADCPLKWSDTHYTEQPHELDAIRIQSFSANTTVRPHHQTKTHDRSLILDIWSLGSRIREKKQREKVELLCFLWILCFFSAEKKQRKQRSSTKSLCFFSAEKKQRIQRKQRDSTFSLCFFSTIREPTLQISRSWCRLRFTYGTSVLKNPSKL